MDIVQILVATLIIGPMALGLLAWAAPKALRGGVVTLAALLTGGAAIATTALLSQAGAWSAGATAWTASLPAWGPMAGHWVELALVLTVLGIGLRTRDWRISILGVAQLILVVTGKLLHAKAEPPVPAATFLVDPLSLILLLVVSVVGSLIAIYALGYMKRHEAHAPETAASTGRFFLVLVGFLGAMNALVMANDLRWLGIFWEMTTLCSFLLIGHDGTDIARRNAARALWINSLGGLAMMGAGLILRQGGQAESLSGLVGSPAAIPVALLLLAAFTKSAQLPFQSWLLGAMVAPTPVSALLHSATMVKAGSYLTLRLAPAFDATHLGYVVAVAGAFTFALAAALAISQSNAKKVLAYSTISNLGLIVACAGINTPLSYAAALMILCFHAVSKGLLFLSVGAIEQEIGSRDIEDMGSIMYRMPVTAAIAMLGMVSMLAPPFGMLLSKWMAIEAALFSPLVLVLVVAGAALTVMFWAKWLGRIQTVSYHERYVAERMPGTMMGVQMTLTVFVVASGLAAFAALHHIEPLVRQVYDGLSDAAYAPLRAVSAFNVWPVFAFVALALLGAFWMVRRVRRTQIRPPFLCGENVPGETSYEFRTIGDKTATAWSSTYYLRPVFSEERLTLWANLAAAMIILTMFGMIGAI